MSGAPSTLPKAQAPGHHDLAAWAGTGQNQSPCFGEGDVLGVYLLLAIQKRHCAPEGPVGELSGSWGTVSPLEPAMKLSGPGDIFRL